MKDYRPVAPVRSMLEVEYKQADKPLNDFPSRLVRHLVADLGLSGKVVDVMCGRGEHAQALADEGLDVWCVDMSPEAAEAFARRDERLALCDVNTDDLPFEDESFDVVFSKSAIEHVNPDHLLAECRRILKPGGKIVVLTLDWYYTYRMHYIDHTHGYGCPWMKHSLKLILDAYGFENIRSENFYYLDFTWKPGLAGKIGRLACTLIRICLPYPYIDNFTNPIWKVIRFSNEVQLLGYGEKA